MHAFDLEYGPSSNRHCDAMILRIYSGEGAHESAAQAFHGTKRLHDAGYPVPRVLNVGGADSLVGAPFMIMERIEGKALWQRVVDSQGNQHDALHAVFCELLYPSTSTRMATFCRP
jgi:aminoglycoside phosphotransferase (APT) family kinase protein